MTLSITKKMLAALAAAALACTLGILAIAPQSAHAAQTSGTPLTTQATGTPLETQATKTSVYVRTALGDNKYTYNKYGLVTKIANDKHQWRFKYSGTKLIKALHYRKSIVNGKWFEDFSYSFKYNSKNRVNKVIATSTGMRADLYNHTATYYYNKKNQATKKVETYPSGSPATTTKYYYNSKGLLKKIVGPYATETLKYDNKGNTISYTRKYAPSVGLSDTTFTYKNTYKNGRLVSFSPSNNSSIKYAKKSVPKKYAAAVKAQQKMFIRLIPDAFAPSVFSF